MRRRYRQRKSTGDEAMKTGKTGCAMGMILMIPMSARRAAEAAT
jgi:hypothetical protein